MARDKKFFIDNIAVHHEAVYRFLYTLTQYDKMAAEDLAQETMIRAWEKINSLKDPASAKSWLFSIAKNSAKMHFRKNSKMDVHTYDPAVLNHLEDLKEDFLDILEKEEAGALLLNLLENLDPKYKSVIKLYYLEEISLKQIADIMHLNYNTVRTHLARGLKLLKSGYEARGGGKIEK